MEYTLTLTEGKKTVSVTSADFARYLSQLLRVHEIVGLNWNTWGGDPMFPIPDAQCLCGYECVLSSRYLHLSGVIVDSLWKGDT